MNIPEYNFKLIANDSKKIYRKTLSTLIFHSPVMNLKLASSIVKGKNLQQIFISRTDKKSDKIEISNHLRQFCSKESYLSLSTPQVNSQKSLFVMLRKQLMINNQWSGYRHSPKEYETYINPKIVDFSQDADEVWEECGSYPNLLFKFNRSKFLIIEYEESHKLKDKVKPIQKEIQGMEAFSFQHESDHLQGRNMIVDCVDIDLVDGGMKVAGKKNFKEKRLYDQKTEEQRNEDKLELKNLFRKFSQMKDRAIKSQSINQSLKSEKEELKEQTSRVQDPFKYMKSDEYYDLRNFIEYEIIHPIV